MVHLHRRAGFAANWSEIQRDLADGPDAAIDRLLHPDPTRQQGDPTGASSDFEKMSTVICDAAVGSANINRLKAWWLYRMLFTPDTLGERLTLMWHNHFATSNLKVADVGLMRQQNAIFREFARGQFNEMVRRVVTDPALLIWLDADANRKEHPNENLAREIMELFTLGIGNYSEDDIKEAARSLTGWSVSKGTFRNYDKYHDGGEKTVFGQRGNWTGDDLLRILIEHPASSRRLAFRICELFMGEPKDDTNSVDELAAGLRERGLDIGWAIETVLRSREFFANGNIGNRVLGPVEFMIGAARALEMTDPPPSTLLLAEATAGLGQDLFNPPNVFGWPGGRSWLTSRALIGRANWASALVAGNLDTVANPFNAAALAESHGFTKLADVGEFYAQLLLGRPQLPAELEPLAKMPNRLVTALLAKPEGQLA